MNHKTDQQNILIVMTDQLTAKALGCYGHNEVISPNIDRIANQGVLFETAYSSSPLCAPGRYAFMTGQNISRCGGYDNAAYLPATMPTFAHYLRLMGYKTYLSGKMHFVGPDQLHGFEERVTTDIYPADFGWVPDWNNADQRIDLWYHNMSSVKQAGVAAITNQLSYDDEVGSRAVQVIYDYARSEDRRPLCLVASFIHPHDPYATRKKYWDLYEDTDISLPQVARPAAGRQDAHNRRLESAIGVDAVALSEQEIIDARRAYYGNVSYIDEWLGRLQDTLDECGMAKNTTIIFTSDHGDMLGEFGLWYKMSFREWSCRIPMIIYNPSRFKPRRVKQAVAHVDMLPTLVDIAAEGADADQPAPIDPLDGRSLLPLCSGNESGDTDRAISEYLAEGTSAPMLMIRQAQYKYISCPTDLDQLFDLERDPDEKNNLAADDAHSKDVRSFKDQAADHWDVDLIREKVITDQQRRRAVHSALTIGRYQGWDFNPALDPGEQYTRSHMDLTAFDVASRYPKPKPFKPKPFKRK
ncbi:choline-sulfatase [Candidatus Spongiihabitans sp.]|uniref:choline-sulfatase n=1 Tax=Candidatus Spongiihabitans sp. TaxID=3101308 RepID=UPI003C6F1DB7